MKNKSQKSQSVLDQFNGRETKGNFGNTAIKSAVDVLAGAIVGPGISAISGKYSHLAGLALILSGHYFGDKSGVLRSAGTSTLAFGIAKAKEYQNNPELNSPEKRLKGLGNDLLSVMHFKWKEEQQKRDGTLSGGENSESSSATEPKSVEPKTESKKVKEQKETQNESTVSKDGISDEELEDLLSEIPEDLLTETDQIVENNKSETKSESDSPESERHSWEEDDDIDLSLI